WCSSAPTHAGRPPLHHGQPTEVRNITVTLSLHVSPALVADATRPTKRVKARRLVKMAGAAALSIGMVGTFAMPAYATAAPVDGAPDGYQAAPAQSMTTPGAEGVDASGALEAPSVALDTDAVEAEEA